MSSGVRGERVSCNFVGNPIGAFISRRGGRELATFFKEMIIRVIIIGINLVESELISHSSNTVRVRNVLHRIPPTSKEPTSMVNEKKDSILSYV